MKIPWLAPQQQSSPPVSIRPVVKLPSNLSYFLGALDHHTLFVLLKLNPHSLLAARLPFFDLDGDWWLI